MSSLKQNSKRNAEWFFFSGGPGAPRYGDDPTKHAVDHDTESFVREVLQNANDQRLNNDEPVEVTFRFVTLTGEDRDDFLETLGWASGLEERVKAVADSERGRGYARLLERVEGGGELRLLVVEDRNTTGLTGEWNQDSNYAALVRDELYSSKQEDTAGGSYGLGKSVLWTFSGASTVLFNSYPVDVGVESPESPIFIARTKLPTHELDGDSTTYQGAGWLCRLRETEEGIQPEALRGERALEMTDPLHIERPRQSGTSAMVVEFRDPTRDARPDIDELADEFVEAAVKYFWPAIYRGDLEVTVETPEETREADVNEVPAIRPFVESYAERFTDDGTLKEPGDVSGLDIPIKLPKRTDGSETPDGSVRLAARLASPADDDSYLNHVALFRGAGMAVKYLNQSRVAFGDRNFHAVLACGEGRTDQESSESDHEIDRFLRFAEPPEHDEWESTENLRERYQQGFRIALEDMFSTVRDGLRHLVAENNGTGDALSDKVLNRFPIHGSGGRRSVDSPSKTFEIDTTSRFDDGRWAFSGFVVPTAEEFDRWSVEVSLTGVGEDGARYDEIPVESVDVERGEVTKSFEDGVARLIADATTDDIKFEGYSEEVGRITSRSGEVGETQLEVRAEIRSEEGE
jgi:hypothetical protein